MIDPVIAATAAQLPPQIPAECLGYVNLAFGWGRWFVALAFIAAVVQTIGAVLAWFAKKPTVKTEEITAGSATAVIEALKGLLIALASLPAWVAIYLAGLALLWMSTQPPKWCPAPPPSTTGGQGAAPGANGQPPTQNTQAAQNQQQAAQNQP